MRPWRWLLAGMFCLMFLSTTGDTAAQEAMEQPMIGEPAPLFELPASTGDGLALESLRGQFVVIHFGASW